jgi:hypothetical protein
VASCWCAAKKSTMAICGRYFDWLCPITQERRRCGPMDCGQEPKTKFSGYHGYWLSQMSRLPFWRWKLMEANHHRCPWWEWMWFWLWQIHCTRTSGIQGASEWATNLYLPDSTLNTERWDDHRWRPGLIHSCLRWIFRSQMSWKKWRTLRCIG